MNQPQTRSPPILVVSDGEWGGRSLESVLQAREYLVTRASCGRDALAALRRGPVGAVIVEEQLPDMSATEFCLLLRRDAAGPATPIIVIASRGISPKRRVEIYTAGAWDYCSQPLDLEVLLLKLETFIGAKRELGDPAERLVDPASDLYTLRGLRRWSRELSARAARGHEPLACLALSTRGHDAARDGDNSFAMATEDAIARTAQFIGQQRRESDVVAYVGGGTFAILAPETGPEGAEQFSQRLKRTAHDASKDHLPRVELQVGYSAVEDFATGELDAEELLRRASTALGHLRRSGRRNAVLRFDDLTT